MLVPGNRPSAAGLAWPVPGVIRHTPKITRFMMYIICNQGREVVDFLKRCYFPMPVWRWILRLAACLRLKPVAICLFSCRSPGRGWAFTSLPSLWSHLRCSYIDTGWNEEVIGTPSKMKPVTAFLLCEEPGTQGVRAQAPSACLKLGLNVCL